MLKRKDIRGMRIYPFPPVMKLTGLVTLLLMTFIPVTHAQYYYKDIILTSRTNAWMATYKAEKVKGITLSSFEGDGKPAEGLKGEQRISANYTVLETILESSTEGASQLTSTFNTAGKLIKTNDKADGASGSSEYFYNSAGRLEKIANQNTTEGQQQDREDHVWYYDHQGRPVKMLRIRNGSDTTHVSFVLDEQGNVTEENPVRKGQQLPSFYYYYDNQRRLTDVVSYNEKAKRLLPAYVFEYDDDGSLMSMMVVPEGSSDYSKWYYSYSEEGLKLKEFCYNKKKELLGSVEYKYSR